MLGGLLATVNVETPPPDEQLAILEALHPSLAPLLRHALAMLAIVQASPPQADRYASEARLPHLPQQRSTCRC
jgi:hypothetical protein